MCCTWNKIGMNDIFALVWVGVLGVKIIDVRCSIDVAYALFWILLLYLFILSKCIEGNFLICWVVRENSFTTWVLVLALVFLTDNSFHPPYYYLIEMHLGVRHKEVSLSDKSRSSVDRNFPNEMRSDIFVTKLYWISTKIVCILICPVPISVS